MKYNAKTLKDYAEFKNGKKRPDPFSIDKKYPVYGGNGILTYTESYNAEACVVIGRVGAYCGSVNLLKGKGWISDNAIEAKPKNHTDLDYLYYLLRSLRLNERRIGTGQPLLTQEILNRIEVDIPKIETQKKFANILRILDDKIELNNAMNKNLEQQAQEIFKSELLSHDELSDGWQESNLLAIADYLNGLAMQKFRPSDDEIGLPVLKIKELRQGACDSNSELCTPKIRSEYIVHDGDVIFSWSGSLLVDFWCGGTCGLNQHLFKVTSARFDKWFYYSWTKHHLAKFAALAADMATTMGHIKRDELSRSIVLIPPAEEYKRIGSLLQPMYDLIISNRVENRRLTKIRDTLLPKLMSGAIDVSSLDF